MSEIRLAALYDGVHCLTVRRALRWLERQIRQVEMLEDLRDGLATRDRCDPAALRTTLAHFSTSSRNTRLIRPTKL